MTPRAAWIVGATWSVTACSLLTSLDGLHAASDASTDSSANDSSSVDVFLDASDAGDTADGPFCQTHPGHTFCADFDEGSLTAGFTSVVDMGVGATALDNNDRSSPPASYEAVFDASAVSQCNEALLEKNLTNNGNHDYHLEFDFESCGLPSISVELFSIIQNAGIDAFSVSADPFSYKLYTEGSDDAGVHTHTYDMGVWPATGWHHVIVDASDLLGKGKSAIQVTVDGTSMLDIQTGWSWSVSLTQLEVGLRACTSASPTCGVHYDNILLDVN
jgi:hypothetical protein